MEEHYSRFDPSNQHVRFHVSKEKYSENRSYCLNGGGLIITTTGPILPIVIFEVKRDRGESLVTKTVLMIIPCHTNVVILKVMYASYEK